MQLICRPAAHEGNVQFLFRQNHKWDIPFGNSFCAYIEYCYQRTSSTKYVPQLNNLTNRSVAIAGLAAKGATTKSAGAALFSNSRRPFHLFRIQPANGGASGGARTLA